MFVVSKRNFKFRTPSGDFALAKDYMGEVPDSLAEHKLFQAAVRSGWIVTPGSHADAEIYKADDVAKKLEQAADIRPDAPKAAEITTEDISKASGIAKAAVSKAKAQVKKAKAQK